MDETKLKVESSTFAKFIEENEIEDQITKKNWIITGIKNYAEISLNDTLSQARDRMKSIDTMQKVRGLVLTNDKQIAGVITYALFGEVVAKEQKLKAS